VPDDSLTAPSGYVGRFAPSPTGPLHRGSLVAALGSWLDARAHHGQWLVRIEDVDTTRCTPAHARLILGQLDALGLHPDGPVWHQSTRGDRYEAALARLREAGRTFACACSRRDIEAVLRARGKVLRPHAERVYPGTCRAGLGGRPARAERFIVQPPGLDGPARDRVVDWVDRRLGPQVQNVSRAVGDFVLRHADGRFTYQLAVVVDDAAQGVTDVVRGEDLADNTARQIVLQEALGFARPCYLHTPLVLAPDGQKLSKQTGAAALDLRDPLRALGEAAAALGLGDGGRLACRRTIGEFLAEAVARWRARFPLPTAPAGADTPVG
jgi:glutamyl-Q tRNA(Asp) synthetase